MTQHVNGSPSPTSGLTAGLVRLGHFFFKVRDGLFPAVFLVLAFGFQPRLAGGDAALDRLVDVLGLAIALAGESLRVIVLGFTPIGRGGRNRRIHADVLMQDGIFAHCRNALYDSNMLVLLGLMVIHNSPWFYAIGLPFYLIAYLSITLAEEDYLRSRFGTPYDDYCARVPRYWIRWGGLSSTLAGMRFDWKKLVRKEYGSSFGWITAAFILMAWQAIANLGWEASRSEAMTLLVFWLPVLALYIVARLLKKSGRLDGKGQED